MTRVDWSKTASDYAQHRQGFPSRLFDWMEGVGARGTSILDLGTGTGLMARELARRNTLANVTAMDLSLDMLREAHDAARREGLVIAHKQGKAEETGLPDESYDLITAGTCWHWFDRAAAIQECLRLLRSGGRLVIAHQDWLTRPGNVIDVTRQILQQWSPPPEGRDMTFKYPEWLWELVEGGFGDYVATAFPAMLTYTHDAWAGRIVASAHIAPVLTSEDVEAFRSEFTAILTERFPGEHMAVEHRVFAICLTRP